MSAALGNQRPKLVWRQLAAHAGPVVAILIGVALATAIVTALPRLVDAVSTEDLEHAIESAPPERRNIVVERLTSLVGRGNAPFWLVRAEGEAFLESTGPRTQSVVTDQQYVIDSPQWIVDPLPSAPSRPFDTTVMFRWQQHLEDHSRPVRGRPPTRTDPLPLLLGDDCPSEAEEREAFEPAEGVDCELIDVPVYEVNTTEQTAADLGLDLGDEVLLRPDSSDRLYNVVVRPNAGSVRLVLRLVGTFELDPIEDEYWFADNRLHRPRVTENPDFRIVNATVVTHGQAYNSARVLLGHPAYRYQWRYRVAPERVTPGNAAALADAIVSASLALEESTPRTARVEVLTGLPELIDEFFDQRNQAIAIASAGVASLVLAASMLLLLLGVLRERQERPMHLLARGRGASRTQLTVAKLVQACGLAVIGAAVGFLAAWLVFPDTTSGVPLAVAAAVAAVTTIALVTPAIPTAMGDLGGVEDRTEAHRWRGRRRVVFELFVLALAAATVVSLRRRGAIDARGSEGLELDLLLAVAPALFGTTIVIVVARVLPPATGALARLGERTRGFVSFFVLRQSADRRVTNYAPVLVVAVALTISVFATTTVLRIVDGQELASTRMVGADYRVATQADGLAFTRPFGLDEPDLVDAWVEASFHPTARVDPSGSARVTPALATDVDRHRNVTDEQLLPLQILSDAAAAGGLGTEDAPVPVVITSAWPEDERPRVGDTFELLMAAVRINAEAVDVIDEVPGLPGRPAELIIDLSTMRRLSPNPVHPTVVYARAGPERREAIEAVATPSGGNAHLTSRYDVLSGLADDPFVRATRTTLVAVVVTAACVALVAVLAALLLLAQSRRRDRGILRTLGADPDRVRALVLYEQLPVMIVAIVGGVVGGVFVSWALGPALRLEAFTGGDDLVSTRPDALAIVLSVAAIMATTATAAVAFARIDRRASLDTILRIGDST